MSVRTHVIASEVDVNDKPTEAPSEPDAAYERLKAADRAADAAPDLGRLGASLRERMASDDAAPVPDEVTSRRQRRAPLWLTWAAAAAAAVVVLGGSGFALGRSTAAVDVASAQHDAPPHVGPERGAGSTDDSEAGGAGIGGPGGAGTAGGASGHAVFTSSGFSASPGSAAAWTFDGRKVYSKETAARIAKVLGVEGEPRQLEDGGGWSVGPGDPSGPGVTLFLDPLVRFQFHDPTRDPHACRPAGSEPEEPEVASGAEAPEVRECPVRPRPGPNDEEAVAKMRAHLQSLGADPESFAYAVERYDPQVARVSAEAVVAGRRTGVMWDTEWVDSGLVSSYGFLSVPVSLGEYAVVSEREAVARLSDPRFGSTFIGPDPGPDETKPFAAPRSVVKPVAPGAEIWWPVENITLTKAQLQLALEYQEDQSVALVPTYHLSADDGRTWTVIAVAERHLDFSPRKQ